MPVVIYAIMLTMKYAGKIPDVPIHYLDSFLPQNRTYLESDRVNELMVIEGSNIITAHNDISLEFDTAKVIAGEYSEEFDKSRDYKECGCFSNSNQLMVDLWGAGFEIDRNQIMPDGNIKRIVAKDDSHYIPEYIGSKQRIRLQAYVNIRKQLALYMEQNIYQAWVDFGKTEAVRKWYRKSVEDNREMLYKWIIAIERQLLEDDGSDMYIENCHVYMIKDSTLPWVDYGPHFYSSEIINCWRESDWDK